LVVDQFEELFTLCSDPARRQGFIDRLLATWEAQARLSIVLTLRADFWGDCAPYAALKDAMQAHQELIAPMTTAELRSAMEQQAAAVGLRFEADLSHRILAEVEGEPGAMPLLQHLLLELWRRRHGRWLRTHEYEALGGIKQAIAHTADGIYTGLRDDPAAQGLLRNLFVRLTRLDDSEADPDGRRDTRQRVPLPELTPAGANPEQVRTLVQRLADARLVVTGTEPDTGQTQVEVSHEALIRHWPRLRGLLDEDRASWILLAAVREQARDWQAGGERETDLPRWGGRLQQAEALFAQERFAPTESERRFVDSAKALQLRRARVARFGVVGAAVLMAISVFFAIMHSRGQDIARSALLLATQERREAIHQTGNVFLTRAVDIRKRDPLGSAQYLARAAERYIASGSTEESRKALNALRRLVPQPMLLTAVAHPGWTAPAVTVDSTRILTWGTDGSAFLWDAVSGEEVTPALMHEQPVRGARFSWEGSRILTWCGGEQGSAGGSARVWDSRTGQPSTPPMPTETAVMGAKLSSDETRVLTWSDDGSARLWDADSGAALGDVLTQDHPILGARFSADGSRFLTWAGSDDYPVGGSARVWDGRNGAPITPQLEHEFPVAGACFGADDSLVLTWGTSSSYPPIGGARLWDSHTGAAFEPIEQGVGTGGAELARDGLRVLTWGDNSARVWDGRSGAALTEPMEHNGGINGARFSADGSLILTWGADGTARVWSDKGSLYLLLKHQGSVTGAQFTADESAVLTWSEDGTAREWEVKNALITSKISEVLSSAEHPSGAILGARFDADQSRLLTWGEDGSARLRDLGIDKPLNPPLMHDGPVREAQFVAKGTRILTWSADGTARLWYGRAGEDETPQSTSAGSSADVGKVEGAPIRAQSGQSDDSESQILINDLAWPSDKLILLVEVESGTALSQGGQVKALSPADWNRKRYCQYDAIRHDLNRLSDAEWAESQRRCQALDQPKQRQAAATTAGAARNADGR